MRYHAGAWERGERGEPDFVTLTVKKASSVLRINDMRYHAGAWEREYKKIAPVHTGAIFSGTFILTV